MKIKIKIEKKHIFLLGILVFTLAGVLLVNAVVVYPSQWHNGDKVLVDVQKITGIVSDEKHKTPEKKNADISKNLIFIFNISYLL